MNPFDSQAAVATISLTSAQLGGYYVGLLPYKNAASGTLHYKVLSFDIAATGGSVGDAGESCSRVELLLVSNTNTLSVNTIGTDPIFIGSNATPGSPVNDFRLMRFTCPSGILVDRSKTMYLINRMGGATLGEDWCGHSKVTFNASSPPTPSAATGVYMFSVTSPPSGLTYNITCQYVAIG